MDVKFFGVSNLGNVSFSNTNSYKRKANKTATSSKKNNSQNPFREQLKKSDERNKAGPIIDDYI